MQCVQIFGGSRDGEKWPTSEPLPKGVELIIPTKTGHTERFRHCRNPFTGKRGLVLVDYLAGQKATKRK